MNFSSSLHGFIHCWSDFIPGTSSSFSPRTDILCRPDERKTIVLCRDRPVFIHKLSFQYHLVHNESWYECVYKTIYNWIYLVCFHFTGTTIIWHAGLDKFLKRFGIFGRNAYILTLCCNKFTVATLMLKNMQSQTKVFQEFYVSVVHSP